MTELIDGKEYLCGEADNDKTYWYILEYPMFDPKQVDTIIPLEHAIAADVLLAAARRASLVLPGDTGGHGVHPQAYDVLRDVNAAIEAAEGGE